MKQICVEIKKKSVKMLEWRRLTMQKMRYVMSLYYSMESGIVTTQLRKMNRKKTGLRAHMKKIREKK